MEIIRRFDRPHDYTKQDMQGELETIPGECRIYGIDKFSTHHTYYVEICVPTEEMDGAVAALDQLTENHKRE